MSEYGEFIIKVSHADLIAGSPFGTPYFHGEIVRCRDCAYICNREYANGLEFHTCSYFDSEHAEVEPDGFCAWGSRRNLTENGDVAAGGED